MLGTKITGDRKGRQIAARIWEAYGFVNADSACVAKFLGGHLFLTFSAVEC